MYSGYEIEDVRSERGFKLEVTILNKIVICQALNCLHAKRGGNGRIHSPLNPQGGRLKVGKS